MSAPMQITDATLQGLLKNVYLKYRKELFPVLTPWLANAKRLKGGMANATWGGNGVFFDAVLTRPSGMTWSSQGYLPPHSSASERQASIGIARAYVRRQLDGLAIQGTAGAAAAYENVVRKVLNEAMTAAKLGQQEAIHGNSRAIKGIITTVNSTTSIVVTSPYGVSGAGQGALLLDQDMYIAVIDTTGVTIRGRAVISGISVSGDNVTLTLASAIAGMAATDIIVPATASDTALDSAPNGLLNILNYGGSYASLHGLSSGTWARWNTSRLVAGTDVGDPAQPTEMDIWTLATLIANRSGKDPFQSPDEFLMSMTPGVYKRLAESFLGQRRWDMGATKKLQGGFAALNIAGLSAIQDYWQVAGSLYMVHLPSLIWVDLMDFAPLAYQGVGPWRFIPDRDGWEWVYGAYYNMGTIQRNAHGMLTGYTDTLRLTHVM